MEGKLKTLTFLAFFLAHVSIDIFRLWRWHSSLSTRTRIRFPCVFFMIELSQVCSKRA